jgi:acetyl esterase/lipase
MLRHGFRSSPIHWREHQGDRFKGVWIISDAGRDPDLVLYYAHGGGFSMGSSYFYLEFLTAWLALLREAGYANPAIFALEYTLVPDASFPVQLQEAVAGYRHVLAVARDPSCVVVGGDSAGAMLVLSMLLHIARDHEDAASLGNDRALQKPAFAVLISPWVTLVSSLHKNNTSDYLDADALHRYGLQYAGHAIKPNDPLVSPGSCTDVSWWQRAAPEQGMYVTFGEKEVFQPDIKRFTGLLRKAGVIVGSYEEPGGIHAWPVASLFLSSSRAQRLKGLRDLVEKIRERVPAGKLRDLGGVF